MENNKGHDPLAVANYLYKINTKKPMTLMKLIKLAYISHGYCLAILDQPLLNEEPQAWKFGPVFPTMYHELKNEPEASLTLEGFKNYNDFQDAEKEIMDAVSEKYGALDGWKLSALTHEEGTPWREAWKRSDNNTDTSIQNEKIKNYYTELKLMVFDNKNRRKIVDRAFKKDIDHPSIQFKETLLHFDAGFYEVIKIIESDLFQIEGKFLIKLKKPSENSQFKNKNFLKNIDKCIVKIIPHIRNKKGEIISDVWMGGLHINKEVFLGRPL